MKPFALRVVYFDIVVRKYKKISTTEGGLYNASLLNNSQTDIALMDNLDVNEIFS